MFPGLRSANVNMHYTCTRVHGTHPGSVGTGIIDGTVSEDGERTPKGERPLNPRHRAAARIKDKPER